MNVAEGEWVVDSGATCHICSDKYQFVELDTSWCEKVTVANGDAVYSNGKGVCKVSMVNAKGSEVVITVGDFL